MRYDPFFEEGTASPAGLLQERVATALFNDLSPRVTGKHDLILGEERVEVKVIRAHQGRSATKTPKVNKILLQRAVAEQEAEHKPKTFMELCELMSQSEYARIRETELGLNLDHRTFAKMIDKHNIKTEVKQELLLFQMLEMQNMNSFRQRALSSISGVHHEGTNREGERHQLGNQIFQQVKPREFDLMLCFVVFRDIMRIYLVPSNKICDETAILENGKIRMSPQHGNPHEGTVTIDQVTKFHVLDVDHPLDEFESKKMSLDRLAEIVD